MAIHKLTAAKVEALVKRGRAEMVGDGGGLWLDIKGPGKASWIHRYLGHYMGVGGYPVITLSAARETVLENRRLLARGIDPLEYRRAQRAAAKAERTLAEAAAVTFRQAAERYIRAHEATWTNVDHARQWPQSLRDYVYPVMGDVPCSAVTTGLALQALTPIWTGKPETAKRVQKRIESVLDYAKVQGWRTGENPAAWKGNLQFTLPARNKVAPVEHHAALDWQAMPGLLLKLSENPGVGALALRFLVLTAARSGEVLGASWGEIDREARIWTIPASRMKAGRPHRVPLSDAATALLHTVESLRAGPDSHLFPGRRGRMAKDALSDALRTAGCSAATVHGFRSTFRVWAGETTNHAREVVEHALAHRNRR